MPGSPTRPSRRGSVRWAASRCRSAPPRSAPWWRRRPRNGPRWSGPRAPRRSELPSRAGVIDEFLRRRLAPLRHQGLLGGQEVRAVGQIQAVAVGPMLVHAAPRIGPVVVDLAAQDMAAAPPDVLVGAKLLEIVVGHADVVDVRHLER